MHHAQPNLASPKFKANPFPFYAQLRKEEPVYSLDMPDKQVGWLVTRYDDVSNVLRDPRLSKDRLIALSPEERKNLPWFFKFFEPLMRNMLGQDPPEHTRLRGLVQKAFSPRLVEQLRGRIEKLSNNLLDDIQREGRLDLLARYALPVPVTIIAEMLGVPLSDQRKFRRWSNRLVANASLRDVMFSIPSVIMFSRYLRTLIEQRRASPGDDLITALIQAEESGDKLTEQELISMFFLLLIAGHETTVNLIASGTLALLQNPDQLERLRKDPSLIEPAVEELLRYTSPVDIATERVAKEPVTIAGTTIQRGEIVFASITSANRDETHFKAPDTLDITREPNKHLSFGFGIHYCLGAPLARLEGQIALRALIERLPKLRLAKPAESLRWRKGVLLRGLEKLPVAV